MFFLKVEAGYNRGAICPLPPGTVLLGRGEEATLRLLAEGVSRLHAELRLREGAGPPLEVRDLGSRNGTLLNGVRLGEEPVGIEPGDVLGLGGVRLRLGEGEAPSQAPRTTLFHELPEETRPEISEDEPQAATTDAPEVELWGESPAFLGLLRALGPVASSGRPVLIQGETGSGKELVARAIHARSPRRRAPFVVVNSASLAGPLLESELFGHERGAFTGADARKLGLVELAGPGVLFLDEIGELPLPAQAKLLRLLEGGDYRRVGGVEPLQAQCQVLAATHRDLQAMAAEGTFRADLYYRLSVLELRVPPLRERGADLSLLIERIFAAVCADGGRRLSLTPAAERALLGWSWPGNVRELRNVLERIAILSPGPEVVLADLPERLRGGAAPEGARTLAEVERRHIARVLREVGGRKAEAAKVLGIDRKTLYRKLKE